MEVFFVQIFIKTSACYLRPSGYAINICPFYLAAKASDKKAVDALYGATCFARRSTNGLRPLSVCLTAKAVKQTDSEDSD